MTNEVDLILERAGKLSADETMTLVQKLLTDLRRKVLPTKNLSETKSIGLVYGKYKDFPGPETTEDDFKLAEYHFNEDDWK
jgi:hypothetical protein